MKKTTVIALVITIIFFGALFIFSAVRFTTDDSTSGLNAAQVNKLSAEKKSIEYSLQSKKNEIAKISTTGSAVFILFDHYTDILENQVISVLDQKSYSAILCCSPEESQFEIVQNLVNGHSWEIAAPLSKALSDESIKDSDSKGIIDNYLNSFKVKPHIACIDSSDYSEDIDSILTDYGISALIIKNGDSSYNYFMYEGDFLKIPDLEFSITNTIETALKKRIASNLPTVISINEVEDKDVSPDNISLERFTIMVNTLENYEGSSNIGQLAEYSSEKIESLNNKQPVIDDLLSSIGEYERRIAEIDAELSALLSRE